MWDLGQVWFPIWAPEATSALLGGRIKASLCNSYALRLEQLVTESEGCFQAHRIGNAKWIAESLRLGGGDPEPFGDSPPATLDWALRILKCRKCEKLG